MPAKRIILDTNWLVSAAINKNSRRAVFRLLTNKRIQIIYADALLEEFMEVIARPKFTKVISKDQVSRFIALILPQLAYVPLKTTLQLSRDKDDDYLLALCVDGHADYLLTGDPDLLVLKKVGTTQILTMSEFSSLSGF